MKLGRFLVVILIVCGVSVLVGCGKQTASTQTSVPPTDSAQPLTPTDLPFSFPTETPPESSPSTPSVSTTVAASGSATANKSTPPPAGNPTGGAAVPAGAGPADTSRPTTVVGTGTAASCTSAALAEAVRKGGIITFACGPRPVTITVANTLRIHNSLTNVVIDGGGKVTLSGAGKRRILYQNTCDKTLTWTTSHCPDQQYPKLTVQNITFADGNSTGSSIDGGGGGAMFVRGGQLVVHNVKFLRNRCDQFGPDLGGAGIRVFDQYHDGPVVVSNSTFGGGAGLGGQCSNGGGISTLGTSLTVVNSVFTHNKAIGIGANPPRPPGQPGGGSGGAIYADGNTYTLKLHGCTVTDNTAREGGSAIFYVSNDRSGTLAIRDSTLLRNPRGVFETPGYKGIFYLGKGAIHTAGSRIG